MATNKNYEDQLKKNPGVFVDKIVKEASGQPAVEVHFEDEDDEPFAVLKVHNYKDDTEMSLRLLPEGKWLLQFGYYDDEDDFIELLQPLTQTEIDAIPKGLHKVMLKVLVSEEGLRVPGSLLVK